MDLYNNEIVAFTLYDHQKKELIIDMLQVALKVRSYLKEVIVH